MIFPKFVIGRVPLFEEVRVFRWRRYLGCWWLRDVEVRRVHAGERVVLFG